MKEIQQRFENAKKWKGRRYVGEMPFISSEKEWIEWIQRNDRKKIGK